MSPAAYFLVFFSLGLLNSIVRAQGRAPHGLAYESPMAFSPSAFDFFHPNSRQRPGCDASECSPLPMAAQVEASIGHESKASGRGVGVGAGGIAGIVFGFVFVVLLAMGVYYVAVTRRANVTRANSVQPHA